MERQLDLFSARTPSFDASFRGARRIELAHGAWIDHVRGWLAGHDALFEELAHTVPWRNERMHIYDKDVVVPRLLGAPPRGGIVEDMRRALSERYGDEFIRVTTALYRDGKDSVAMHGDTTARDMVEALVATVSLGAPRRLLLKPTEGGPSMPFELGGGDLFVMGGTCQRTWRHGIPKVKHAGPRIAIMFRPKWGEQYDG
ncbi:MAG TPA: alpha-ketoglutarate-dependent dioxygenase AlkB [Kofleriaceae bacterium]|nr:alpha-ketoglutarate-dependent dioxygenase AlkB [Kofleriaceae bacterium]